MKKISLIVIFIISYSIAYCQLDQGTWLAGGSGSFYSYHELYTTPSYALKNKYTEVNFSSSVGYFLEDKLAGGLRGNLSFLKEKNISYSDNVGGGSTHSTLFSVGPFVRYYFLNSEKVYNILADVCYQFGANHQFQDKGKNNIFSIMFGTELYFNTAVGMEILAGYFQKINSLPVDSGINISNKKGFQASIGFQFHLSNK